MDLTYFWELNEGLRTKHISEADRRFEEHFQNHVQRPSEGRYIVALPFNEILSSLRSSKTTAMKRHASLHHQFQRDQRFETAYRAVIQEYLELGHMCKVASHHQSDNEYCVIKDTSSSTKLRVVCVGVNDTLYTGPKLQEDLFDILLRFRSYQYVLIADIEKMYRQFLMRPEDRKYQ